MTEELLTFRLSDFYKWVAMYDFVGMHAEAETLRVLARKAGHEFDQKKADALVLNFRWVMEGDDEQG